MIKSNIYKKPVIFFLLFFFLHSTEGCADEDGQCLKPGEASEIQNEAGRQAGALHQEMILERQNNPDKYRCSQDEDCVVPPSSICFFYDCESSSSLPRKLVEKYSKRRSAIHQECRSQIGEECEFSPGPTGCPDIYYGRPLCCDDRCVRGDSCEELEYFNSDP